MSHSQEPEGKEGQQLRAQVLSLWQVFLSRVKVRYSGHKLRLGAEWVEGSPEERDLGALGC